MNRRIYAGAVCLTAVCLVVLTIAAPLRTCGAAEPPKAPTTQPARVSPAKVLASYIQIIKTDKDPAVVLRAYTRACADNRMNPELNSAYMRSMLLLGRPRAAYMSARILSAQDSDAGLAWAVIGYILGRSNKYLDSMTATARALEFNSDDPSILNNAGQLAAWFDNATATPRLGDREKRIMDKLKTKFQANKAYKDAYARINTVYADDKVKRATLDSNLTASENKYNEVRTEELTMRANLKRIRGQFIQLNKKLEELEKDLRQNRSRLNITDEFGRHVYNQRSILAENTRIQKEIGEAEEKKNDLKKEGTPMVPKVQVATKMGLKLRKDIAGYRASLKAIKPAILRKLRWDPPSVDGVFTPEGANLPRKIRPTTRPSTKPRIMATSSEKVAARKLRMAKLYISNNRPKHALKLIEEILTDYPKTKTAVQAKELLKRMSPE
jgi:hypothetical protein